MYNREEAVSNITLLTKETDTELLTLLVKKAEQTILTLCNIKELPEDISDLVEDIACYRYNQRGFEGMESQSLGGVGVSISKELPPSIMTRLTPYKKLRLI